jgi:hypothetical protein
MENTQPAHFGDNGLPPQFSATGGVTTLRRVGQDKSAPQRERIASTQPASLKKVTRSHHLNTNPSRSQKQSSTNRKTVPLTLWVEPGVKAEIERRAASEGVSLSTVGGVGLKHWIQQSFYTQHTALLEPIIEKAIRKQMRSYSNRIAILLVRSLFASEQTRSITTNILGRQPGVTQPVLEEILNGSSRAAKRNITRITPQLADLLKEVEQWMEEGEKPHA